MLIALSVAFFVICNIRAIRTLRQHPTPEGSAVAVAGRFLIAEAIAIVVAVYRWHC